MFFQTEAKPQGWRAVAVFDDRTDRLVYLGRSSTQVRAGLAEAYFEVLDDEERDHVKSVSLQRSERHARLGPLDAPDQPDHPGQGEARAERLSSRDVDHSRGAIRFAGRPPPALAPPREEVRLSQPDGSCVRLESLTCEPDRPKSSPRPCISPRRDQTME